MKMTEQLFYDIKEAVKRGKTQEEIAAFFGVGKNAITYVNKSSNYAEYHATRYIGRQTANKPTDNGNKTMIVSFDQFKALAKDVDSIKHNMEPIITALVILKEIAEELLAVWKEDN